MEDRLRQLGKSLKQTAPSRLRFTEKHKAAVRQEIKKENILDSTLQLLTQERTGIELMQLLRARGITKFENQEGFLYTMLHQLEKEDYLSSSWDGQQQKYYRLNSKGKKLLNSLEVHNASLSPALKSVLGGAV